jgi:hypothetical protein
MSLPQLNYAILGQKTVYLFREYEHGEDTFTGDFLIKIAPDLAGSVKPGQLEFWLVRSNTTLD